MPRKEALESGGGPTAERRPLLPKEKPEVKFIEWVCSNIAVVETGEVRHKTRMYEVRWSRKRGKEIILVCHYFTNLKDVLSQHERVMEKYLGTVVPLAKDELLEIPGESQKMLALSKELVSLSRQHLVPFTKPSDAGRLKRGIAAVIERLGSVTNEYKVKAQAHLQTAVLTAEEKEREDKLLAAQLALMGRNEECLRIVQGTLMRYREVREKRREWEQLIYDKYLRLGRRLQELRGLGQLYEQEQQGRARSAAYRRAKQQIINEVTGQEAGILKQLNGIAGPEYWRRIQTRDVQNLRHLGELLTDQKEVEIEGAKKWVDKTEKERRRDLVRAAQILEQAIIKFERVVKEKEEREELEKRQERDEVEK